MTEHCCPPPPSGKSSSNSKRPSAVYAERVMQLRNMLREARKQKLSAGLRARREKEQR